jgi:hypothetical protein
MTVREVIMNARRARIALFAGILIVSVGAASSQQLSKAEATTVTSGVRTFVAAVADGVTQRGPMAWRSYFADTPAFLMAVDGHLVFDSSDAATRGIQDVAKSIPHIELQWGDVRIDPLTPRLAMVAAQYHELQIDAGGRRKVVDGYFTALTELGPSGWHFRNAHWSTAAPPPSAP